MRHLSLATPSATKHPEPLILFKRFGTGGNRTRDLAVMSRLLYQLSYHAVFVYYPKQL